jgi:hypothetical protein
MPQPVFRLFFEFLRMSPSYEIARMKLTGELNPELFRAIPADFDLVEKTYHAVGDVRKISFQTWWRQRGKDILGVGGVQGVRVIRKPPSSKRQIKGENHLATDPPSPSDLVIVVPTELKYADALAQVKEALVAHRSEFSAGRTSQVTDHALAISKDRIHEEKLMKGLILVQLRAEHPDEPLWKIGTQARISDAYADELRPAKNEKKSIVMNEYEKNIMTKLTSRAIKNHELIIENAARGKFPSTEKVATKFNYEIARDLLAFYESY